MKQINQFQLDTILDRLSKLKDVIVDIEEVIEGLVTVENRQNIQDIKEVCICGHPMIIHSPTSGCLMHTTKDKMSYSYCSCVIKGPIDWDINKRDELYRQQFGEEEEFKEIKK